VGTADFTHPAWFGDIKKNLHEAEPGLYKLENGKTRFIISTEISCIYSQGGKCRRVHICLLIPSIDSAEKIIADFTKRGFNLKSDGRPIIGMSAKNLAKAVLDIEPRALVIPAHVWTPWFAVFGSKSGFDSLQECFEELTPQIYAIETGLSSDPPMNWRLSALDNITLLSNSDAHSLGNLGREANVLEIDENNLSYDEIYRIIKEKDKKKFLYTIEFFPEEGKYHVDGHADCKFSCTPEDNLEFCPTCGKKLILGVLHRVNELADRKNINHDKFIGYKNLIPLQEIIADNFGVGKSSKKVLKIYYEMTDQKTEFEILIDLSEEEIKNISNSEIARAVINVRLGKVALVPGYDGVYGKISIEKDITSPSQDKLI
jgi:uncharacterized protein (TIGR00375 family)